MTDEVIFNFIVIGFLANVVCDFIAFIIRVVALMMPNIKNKQLFLFFLINRKNAFKQNDPLIITLNQLCVFLPMFRVWILSIQLFYLLKYRNTFGLIYGISRSDEFAIIQLAKF